MLIASLSQQHPSQTPKGQNNFHVHQQGDKQSVAYTYHGILPSFQKEQDSINFENIQLMKYTRHKGVSILWFHLESVPRRIQFQIQKKNRGYWQNGRSLGRGPVGVQSFHLHCWKSFIMYRGTYLKSQHSWPAWNM